MAKLVLLNVGDAQERRLALLEARAERHALVLDELAARVLELERAINLAWVHELGPEFGRAMETHARRVAEMVDRIATLEARAAAAAGDGEARPREEEG